MIQLYRSGERRVAAAALLDLIDTRLRAVTLNVPDYEALQNVRAARRLYTPAHLQLTVEQYLELERRFAIILETFGREPKLLSLVSRIQRYRMKMHLLNVRDVQVASLDVSEMEYASGFSLLFGRSAYLLFVLCLALPVLILNAPIGAISRIWAIREVKRRNIVDWKR